MNTNKLFIVLLALSACSTVPAKTSSEIIGAASEYCREVDSADMRRGYCVWTQIQVICADEQSDAKICNELKFNR